MPDHTTIKPAKERHDQVERTLRDHFAGLALQAIIAASAQPAYTGEDDMDAETGRPYSPSTGFWAMREEGPGATPLGQTSPESFATIAAWEAYAFADAMIAERTKKGPTHEQPD